MQGSAGPAAEQGKEIEGEDSRKFVTRLRLMKILVMYPGTRIEGGGDGRLTICIGMLARRCVGAVPEQALRRHIEAVDMRCKRSRDEWRRIDWRCVGCTPR